MERELDATKSEWVACIDVHKTHFLPPTLPTYHSQTGAGHVSPALPFVFSLTPLPHQLAQVVVSNVNRDAGGPSPMCLGYIQVEAFLSSRAVSLAPVTASAPLCLLPKTIVLSLFSRICQVTRSFSCCSPCRMIAKVIYDKETGIHFIGSL